MIKATKILVVQLHPTQRQNDIENLTPSSLNIKRMDHPLKNSLKKQNGLPTTLAFSDNDILKGMCNKGVLACASIKQDVSCYFYHQHLPQSFLQTLSISPQSYFGRAEF